LYITDQPGKNHRIDYPKGNYERVMDVMRPHLTKHAGDTLTPTPHLKKRVGGNLPLDNVPEQSPPFGKNNEEFKTFLYDVGANNEVFINGVGERRNSNSENGIAVDYLDPVNPKNGYFDGYFRGGNIQRNYDRFSIADTKSKQIHEIKNVSDDDAELFTNKYSKKGVLDTPHRNIIKNANNKKKTHFTKIDIPGKKIFYVPAIRVQNNQKSELDNVKKSNRGSDILKRVGEKEENDPSSTSSRLNAAKYSGHEENHPRKKDTFPATIDRNYVVPQNQSADILFPSKNNGLARATLKNESKDTEHILLSTSTQIGDKSNSKENLHSSKVAYGLQNYRDSIKSKQITASTNSTNNGRSKHRQELIESSSVDPIPKKESAYNVTNTKTTESYNNSKTPAISIVRNEIPSTELPTLNTKNNEYYTFPLSALVPETTTGNPSTEKTSYTEPAKNKEFLPSSTSHDSYTPGTIQYSDWEKIKPAIYPEIKDNGPYVQLEDYSRKDQLTRYEVETDRLKEDITDLNTIYYGTGEYHQPYQQLDYDYSDQDITYQEDYPDTYDYRYDHDYEPYETDSYIEQHQESFGHEYHNEDIESSRHYPDTTINKIIKKIRNSVPHQRHNLNRNRKPNNRKRIGFQTSKKFVSSAAAILLPFAALAMFAG
jgi:hypothetical protein